MLGSAKEIPIPKPRSIRPTAAVIKPRQARKDPSVTSPTTASPVCNSHPPLTTQQPPSPSNWTEQSPISERVRKLIKEDETSISTVGTTNTMAAVLEKFRRSKSHSRSRVTRASILRKHVTSKTLESKPDLISTARDKISFEFEHSPVPNISPGLNYKPRNSHKPTSSLNGHAKDITRRFYSSLSQKAPTPEKTHHSTQYLEPVTRVSAEPESVIPVKGSERRNSPRKVSETRNWLKESSETRNLPRDCCKGSFTSEPRSDITAGADAIPDACECQTNLASTGLVLEPKYIETSQSIPSAPRSSPDLLGKRRALSCHQKQRFGFYAVQEKYSGDSTEFSSVNKLGSLVASMPSEKVFIHQDVGLTSMNPRSTLEASLKNACVESDSLTMWEQNSTRNSRTKASDLRQEMVGEDDDGELPKTAFLPGVSRKDRNRQKRKSTGIQDTLVDCNIGRTNDTTTGLSGFETVTFANQSSNKVGYESAQQELNTTRNAREKSPNEGGLRMSKSGAAKRHKPKKSHRNKRGSPPTTSLQSVPRDVRNEPVTSRRVMEVSMETRDDFSGTAGERKRNYESSSPEINDSQVLLDEPSMYTSVYDSSSDILSQQSQSSRESDVELNNDISAGQSKQSSKRSFKGNLQSESSEGKRKSKHGTSFSNELGGASSPPRSRKIEQKQNRKIKDNRQTDAFYDSKRANDFDMSFKSSKEDKRLPKPTPKSSKNKLANAPSRNLKGAGITKTTPLPTSKSSSYSDSDDDDETATVSHKKVQTTLDGDSKRRRSGRRNILQSLADSTYGVLAFICRTLRPFDLLARPQPCRVNREPPKTAADPGSSKADVPEEEKEDEEDNLEKRKGLVATQAGVEQPKAVAQPEVNVEGNCGWLNTSSYYPGCDPLCDVEYEMILIPTFEPVCPRLDQANQLKSEADEASRRGHEEHLKENNSFGQDEFSHHDSTRYTPLSSQSLRACEEYGPMADYRRPRAGEEYGPMYEYPRPRACEEYGPMYEYPRPRACEEYGPMADYRKPRRRGKERPRSRRRYEENMPEVDSPSPKFYEDNIHMTRSNIHNPKEADNAYMTRYPRSARDDPPEDLSPEYDQNEETTATQPVDNDNSSTGFSQALDTGTTQSESNQLESEADKARQSQENRYMKKAEKPRRNQANHVESEADKERQNQANHVKSEADKERQNQARQPENETDVASRNQANQLKSEADRAKQKQAIRAKRKHEKARRSHAKKVVNKPDEPNQNQANQSKNETDEARQSQANPSESEADEASRRENEKNLEPVEQATPKDDQEDDLTKSETEILPTGKSKEKGPDRRYFYKTTAAILRNKKRAVSRILAGKHTNKQNNSLVVAASCPGRVSECECLPFDEKTIPHQYASNHAESFVLFPDPHRKCLMVSSSDRHGLSCQTESPGGCGEDEIHTLTSRRRGEAINLYDGFPKVLEYESLGNLQDHSNYCDSLDHVSMYNQTHLNPDNQRGKHSSRWANVDLRASLPRETFDGARTCQWFGQFGESSPKLCLKTRSRSLDVQSHRNVSQNQSCSPENIDDFFCSGHSLRKSPDKTRNRGSDKKPVLLTPKFVNRQSTKEQHLSAWNRHHSANGVEISYRRNLDMCDNMSLNKNALPPPPHTTEEESNGEFHSANTQTAQTRLRDGPGGNTNVSKSVKDDQPSAELSTSFQDAKSQSEAEEQGHSGDPVSENSQQPNFEIEDNTEYRDLNDEHEIPENTGKIDKAKYDNVPETGSSANTQNITESSGRQQLPCSDEERGTGKHRPTDRPQRLAHSTDRKRSAPQWDGPADRRDNVSPVNCYKADQLEFDPEDQRSPNLVVPLGSTSTSTGVKSERKDDTRSPVSTDYETPKRECVGSWIGSGSNPDRPKYKCGRYDDRHSTRRGLGDLDYYQIPRSTRRGVGNNVGPSSSNELGNRYSRERFSGRKRYQPRGDSCERETRPRSRSYVNEARSCYCGYCNSNKESDVKEHARQSQSFSSKYPSGKDTSGPKDFWRSRRETPQDIAQNSSPEDAMPRETRTETGRDGAGSRYRPASGSSNRQFYQSHQARLSPRAQLSPSPRFAQSTGTRKFYERVPQSGHDDPEFSPRGQEVDQSSRRQARARRTSRTRDFQESTGSSVSRHGIIEEAGKKGSQRYKSSSKRQRRVAIEPRFRSPAKHGQSRVAYVDQFSCDDSGYVEAGCKREHRIGSRKISFMGLRGGRVYCPPLKKKAGKDDDMPPKVPEKPSPPGVLIFQIAARYATFGGIRVAGGVRVLMDAPEKLGYVQIVSPLGQPFITHYVNTMSFLHSSSAAGVAWSAVVWDTGEEDSANNNKKKGKKESDDIVGRVDSAQVIFCEPYQAHRFRAVLETIKAAFSGGDGALITPNVPPIPGANNIFNPCNPCNPFNPCNPCPDPCNPGPCGLMTGNPIPCPTVPNPDTGFPCQMSFPPFPPPHSDPCCGGNGVTSCCAPPCCPQPSVCPPPFCSQACCPPETMCMPPCTTPCPMPMPTSFPGQCAAPSCCPDDCDPYAYTNAYGKTLFCQMGCLVKLGREEVWLEMYRGNMMVIQEPHSMGFSLVLVNEKQVVLVVQKLSRKTDFKPSPHTQYGFLYTACTTTEKGSLHENFLVSFQCKAHAEQFCNVVTGCKRIMAMSGGNLSNSAVCAPGTLKSCVEDQQETNADVRAKLWETCPKTGPCGVPCGCANSCYGDKDYSPVAARNPDCSCARKSSGPATGNATGGRAGGPRRNVNNRGFKYVGPSFRHGHGREDGRVGCLGKMVRGGAPPGQIPEASGLAPTSGPPVTWEGGPRSPAAQRSETASEPGDVGTLSRHQSDNVAANTVRKEPSRTSPPETTSDTGPDQTTT